MEGRFAVVTGAAGGIGRATCLRLAQEGGTVACLDIDLPGARATAREAGAAAHAVRADITREEEVLRAVGEVAARHPVDVLVNVAGVNGPQAGAALTSTAGWDRTHAVNLRGSFLVAKHTLPHLTRRRGAIVNISSALAFVGYPMDCAYGPTKAGMVQLTQGMALDYAPDVRVNCVCPGVVRTPMTDDFLRGAPDTAKAVEEYGTIHPLHRRPAWPHEIADAVLFLVSDDAASITGVALPVDAGFLAGPQDDTSVNRPVPPPAS
ncbi:3-oxoacyl-ACP reductase [Streptomyces ruber]|uniref:3-oxoacyl-ACP reductase n=3 Tax=Streptomyces TaxID=1883 RepID=A0A918EU52_9ACTN|nr:3-oxoacyl-ACP reductase [Streptomyces ruber]